jgi:hypothetical protein
MEYHGNVSVFTFFETKKGLWSQPGGLAGVPSPLGGLLEATHEARAGAGLHVEQKHIPRLVVCVGVGGGAAAAAAAVSVAAACWAAAALAAL